MKKILIAILGVVTIACVVFGSLWHFGAFGNKHSTWNLSWPFFEKSLAGDFSNSQLLPQNITELYVDASIANVTVQVGSANSVEMKWSHDVLEPIVSVDGSVVRITQTDKHVHLAGRTECKIIISIAPQLSLVNIFTDVGNISMTNVGALECTASCDVGNINLTGGNSGNLLVTSDTGNVRLEGVTFNTCSAKSDVGNVRVELPSSVNAADYSLSLKTDVGNIHAFGQSYKHSFTRSSSGNKFINAESDVGNIRVE